MVRLVNRRYCRPSVGVCPSLTSSRPGRTISSLSCQVPMSVHDYFDKGKPVYLIQLILCTFLFLSISLCHHPCAQLRVAWFFIQLASQDLATQRKGLVALYWLLGSRHAASDLTSFHLGRNAAATVAPYFSVYPVRMAAIHLCFNESSFRYVFNFGTMVIERTTRVRCKAHIGKFLPLLHILFVWICFSSPSYAPSSSLFCYRYHARSDVFSNVLRDTQSHSTD